VYLDDFYIIKFAYHFFEFVNASLFHRNRRDFSEFLIHHILTMVLISYSYLSNFLPMGMVIMFTMDFSDIFVATFKLAVDLNEVF
jgi:acyl-CoA-dependent ceramide synthase